MAESSSQSLTPKASRAPRRIDGRIPPGCKSITVIVPYKIYYHVQTQASLSCLDPPDYLYNFLQEAVPLQAVSKQLKFDNGPSPR